MPGDIARTSETAQLRKPHDTVPIGSGADVNVFVSNPSIIPSNALACRPPSIPPSSASRAHPGSLFVPDDCVEECTNKLVSRQMKEHCEPFPPMLVLKGSSRYLGVINAPTKRDIGNRKAGERAGKAKAEHRLPRLPRGVRAGSRRSPACAAGGNHSLHRSPPNVYNLGFHLQLSEYPHPRTTHHSHHRWLL